MSRVRWVSSQPALCWDPDHHRMVKVVRKISRTGLEYEEYSVDDADGSSSLTVPIPAPEEPKAIRKKRPQQRRM